MDRLEDRSLANIARKPMLGRFAGPSVNDILSQYDEGARGMVWKFLPMSKNIEDRRDEWRTMPVEELYEMLLAPPATSTPLPHTLPRRGPYDDDIEAAAKRESFRTILENLPYGK
jgi:hypothetical protein